MKIVCTMLLLLVACSNPPSKCEQLRSTEWGKEMAQSSMGRPILTEVVERCEIGEAGDVDCLLEAKSYGKARRCPLSPLD